MPDDRLAQGIAALKAGDKPRARGLLTAAISANARDEQAWLWLSGAVETDAARVRCLQQVLALDPDHAQARRGLAALQAQASPRPVKLVQLAPATLAPARVERLPSSPASIAPPAVTSAPPAPRPNEKPLFHNMLLALVYASQFSVIRWLLIAVVVIVFVTLAVQGNTFANKPAPDFALNTPYGLPFKLSGLRGNVVLVNFWATWCGPCRAELPDLGATYLAHRNEGLIVLGVDSGESAAHVFDWLAATPLPYPVLLDADRRVTRLYRTSSIPRTFVVDRRGVVRMVLSGSKTRAQFEQAIQPLLAEKP